MSHTFPYGGTDLCFLWRQPNACEVGWMDTGLVHHGVSDYSKAFTGSHCTYPQSDGQDELIGDYESTVNSWFINNISYGIQQALTLIIQVAHAVWAIFCIEDIVWNWCYLCWNFALCNETYKNDSSITLTFTLPVDTLLLLKAIWQQSMVLYVLPLSFLTPTL